MTDALALVYIASAGRSGSTILEMLLNESPQLWTLGEFQVLPWEMREHRLPCGCGAQVDVCEFWGPILRELLGEIEKGSIARFRRSHNADRLIRPGDLRDLFRGGVAERRNNAQAVKNYAADNELVLRAALTRASELGSTDVRWLIDSSKSPYRLMWLAASGRFDLRVIHLVKDPRAFVYSMYRHARGIARVTIPLRATARWQIENRMFQAVVRNYLRPEVVRLVRYEDLAREPARVISDLCRWLGVPCEFASQPAITQVNHGIAGNPSRFGKKQVSLDEKWRANLPKTWKAMSLVLNRGLARQLGYGAAPRK